MMNLFKTRLSLNLDIANLIVCANNHGLITPHIGNHLNKVLSKTIFNKMVGSPENVKSLLVLSPGVGGWN